MLCFLGLAFSGITLSGSCVRFVETDEIGVGGITGDQSAPLEKEEEKLLLKRTLHNDCVSGGVTPWVSFAEGWVANYAEQRFLLLQSTNGNLVG